MIVSILQPSYLPWLGFFEQMCKSDIFVIYDTVPYDKNGWRNRNRIKIPSGIQWLSVPVHVKFSQSQLINEVLIDNKTNWQKKHLLSLRQNYSKAFFYRMYISIFEEAYLKNWQYLVDIDMYFIIKLAECLGINTKKIVKSSTLNLKGDRIERLIQICKIFNADVFYEGEAGRNYIDENIFFEQGIKVEFQNYLHPIYNQLYGNFIPYLSVVDLIFNHGKESRQILTK